LLRYFSQQENRSILLQ